MTATAAHQVPAVYARLGIQTGRLGAVMLDCEPLDLGDSIAPEDLYTSSHPDRRWIRGAVGEHSAHVTLLYGFLSHLWPDHDAFREDVQAVLWAGGVSEWPEKLRTFSLGAFPSTFDDEPYSCLIAHVDPQPLLGLHRALTLLPHLQTFAEYRPHVTLAYVRRDAERRALAALHNRFGLDGPELTPTAINYGGTRPWEDA